MFETPRMMPSFTWEIVSQESESTNSLIDIFTPYPEHWRKWEIASCEEWNSGHDWTAAFYMDDEGYGPQLDVYCPNCPLTVQELYCDYTDSIYGTLDDIVIDGGNYIYTEDKLIKVNVELHVEKYTSMNSIGPEYDVWIELTKREQPW